MLKMKNLLKRIISLVLIVTMIFSEKELKVLAEEIEDEIIEEEIAEEEEEKTKEIDYTKANIDTPVSIVSEIVESRNEFSKEYLLSDGSRSLVVYDQPVHYLSEAGNYVEIDNSLVETEEGYENADNEYDVTFTDNGESQGEVKFEADDYKIDFSYIDDMASEESPNLETEVKDAQESVSDVIQFGHVINSSTITYDGYNNGVKLEYEPVSSGVKENIIVNEPGKNRFVFKINTYGLTPRINEFNEVELIDKDSNQVKYYFPAPFMEDADGNYSEEVYYSFADKNLTVNTVENDSDVKEIPETDEYESKDTRVEDTKVEDTKVEDTKVEDISEDSDDKLNTEVDIENESLSESESIETEIEGEIKNKSEDEIVDNQKISEEADKDNVSEENEEETEEDSTDSLIDSDVSEDDTGNENHSVNNDEFIYLSIIADDAWMAEASYPVIIDPIIKPVINVASVDAYSVSNQNARQTGNFYSGLDDNNNLFRAFIKFDLPNIGTNRIISDAELNIKGTVDKTKSKNRCDYVVIKKINSDWSYKGVEDKTTLVWDNKPSCDERNIDFVKMVNGNSYFNITKPVREWYEGISPNYGLSIQSYDESRYGVFRWNITDSNTPFLKITYRDMTGLEEYWGTHQTAVGTAGNGYINDYTGALTIVNEDVTTKGQRKPLDIKHVYNSNSDADDKWSLNYDERIYIPAGETDITNYPYVYVDEDGTRHFFKGSDVTYFENGAQKVVKKGPNKAGYMAATDEDGLKLFIVPVNDATLKEKYPLKLIDKSGSNVKYFDASGHLALITDSNQYENGKNSGTNEKNRIEISYEEYGEPASKDDFNKGIEAAGWLRDNILQKENPDEITKNLMYDQLDAALDSLLFSDYVKYNYNVAKNVVNAQKEYTVIINRNVVKLDTIKAKAKLIAEDLTKALEYANKFEMRAKRIVSVTDAVNRTSVIKYDVAGNLVSISDPSHNNLENKYFYDELGRLTQINYCNGKKAFYTYIDGNHVSSMQDDSGYRVNYSYSGGHVSKVEEFDAEGNPGQTYSIEYCTNNTNKFRFSGLDDVYGNDDDVINTYVFDAQGRNISVYSNIIGKTEILGSQATTYADNIGKNIARTTYNDQNNSAPSNYLRNGNFENGLDDWKNIKGNESEIGESETHYLGAESARIKPNGQISAIYQEVDLGPGNYVLSYRTMNTGNNTYSGSFETVEQIPNNASYATSDGDWKFVYTSIHLDTQTKVYVFLCAQGNSETYFDSVVLENGSIPTGYFSNSDVGSASAKKDSSYTRHKIKDNAVKGRQTSNLLVNHDFEYNDGKWTAYSKDGKPAGKINVSNLNNDPNISGEYIGSKSALFNVAAIKGMYAGVKQAVKLGPGTYTFSSYVNSLNTIGTNTYLVVTDEKGNRTKSQPIESTVKDIDKGWKRIDVTFSVDGDKYKNDKSEVTVAIETECAANAIGKKIFCDSVQLETGCVANSYNILEDGSFELADSNTPYRWENTKKATFVDEILSNEGVDGGKCYHITGEPGANKFLKCKPILCKKNESYILSGWFKTDSAPVRDKREIKVKVSHSDENSYYESSLGLDEYSEGWKYFSLILPAHNWRNVAVEFQFGANIGDFYLDDLQLSKNDVYTNDYTKTGNIIAYNQGKKSASNGYDVYNRLNKTISPSGATQTITYNKTNHATKVTSTCGPDTTIGYDKYGNVIKQDIYKGESNHIYAENTYTDDGNYLASTLKNNGSIVKYTFDENLGLKTSETVPAYRGFKPTKISYDYDDAEHISEVTKTTPTGAKRNIKYGYGAFDDLASIEHNGFKYEYTYDGFGNVLTKSIAGTVIEANTYNEFNGSLKTTTFADGSQKKVKNDEYGNIKEAVSVVNGKEKTTDRYKYYNNGNVAKHFDDTVGLTEEYRYNVSNDVVSVKESVELSGKKHETENLLTYNTSGGVENAIYMMDGVKQKYLYTYDKDGKSLNSVLPDASSFTRSYDILRRNNKNVYIPKKGADPTKKLVVKLGYEKVVDDNKNRTDNNVTTYENLIGATTTKADSGFEYSYDAEGNIQEIKYSKSATKNAEDNAGTRVYRYNSFGEIQQTEEHFENGKYKKCSYHYDEGGNITKEVVRTDDGVQKSHEYNYDAQWKDKLISYDNQKIEYDDMGHPTNYLGKEMRWNAINNSLTYVKSGENEYKYKYTSGGKRIQKKTNQGAIDYIYSGDVLLSEITDKDRLNYYYDSEGNVIEIGYQKFDGADYGAETRYFYTRNGQGDIIGIYRCSDSVRVGSYEYDLWGNLISISENDAPKVNVKDDVFILKRNPLRYRGYYYDSETKFYYLNSRYYDPAVHRFISADSIIAGVSEDVNGYNLFEYCNNNPINQKDASGYLPELTNNQKIAVGLAVITTIAVVGAITVATAGVGAPLACTAYGMLNGAIIGSVSGAASEAVMSGGRAYLATGDAQAAKQAAIDGAADGFMWGSVTGAVTGGMKSPHCFVAGTLVCTVDGEVPIEDIEVGDYVLAENPDTGEIDYKPVLETYEHDTYDVVYLTIDGEEFTTTEGHPFFTLERGFVKAGELRYSDTLVDSEGNNLHLDKKCKAHLENPVTVYNFAVEDYHTYFVGENDVLVHNSCGLNFDSKQLGKKWGKHMFDYPDMGSVNDYKKFAQNIFSNPDKIIKDTKNGEMLYLKGKDLLRTTLDGKFISAYPGAYSGRVLNALKSGGLIWPK